MNDRAEGVPAASLSRISANGPSQQMNMSVDESAIEERLKKKIAS